MDLDSRYQVGFYRERLNRFVMRVDLEGSETVRAFCPNTSRLIGLLESGVEVLLTQNDDPDRKTDYTIRAFRDNGVWVGIEAVRANELFDEYLRESADSRFGTYSDWEREVFLHESQIDFCRRAPEGDHWVEVKSLSSRADDGDAFYSGTPSKRGYRHLDDLSRAVGDGDRSTCVFVIQRNDVEGLSPASVTQADWLNALRSAREAGVSILAFRCAFDGSGWTIEREIPTEL